MNRQVVQRDYKPDTYDEGPEEIHVRNPIFSDESSTELPSDQQRHRHDHRQQRYADRRNQGYYDGANYYGDVNGFTNPSSFGGFPRSDTDPGAGEYFTGRGFTEEERREMREEGRRSRYNEREYRRRYYPDQSDIPTSRRTRSRTDRHHPKYSGPVHNFPRDPVSAESAYPQARRPPVKSHTDPYTNYQRFTANPYAWAKAFPHGRVSVDPAYGIPGETPINSHTTPLTNHQRYPANVHDDEYYAHLRKQGASYNDLGNAFESASQGYSPTFNATGFGVPSSHMNTPSAECRTDRSRWAGYEAQRNWFTDPVDVNNGGNTAADLLDDEWALRPGDEGYRSEYP